MRKHKLITVLSMVALMVISSFVWMGTAGTDLRLVRTQYYTSYATGAAAIDFEVDNAHNLQVVEVRITLDSAGNATDTLTLKLDSALGAAYDLTFVSESLSTDEYYYWAPGLNVGPIIGTGDKFTVDLPNDTSATYGLEVVWRRFY